MNKTFIDQLLGFISTPFGLIGIAIGLLMVAKAGRDRPTAWLLFSLCCFASSLNTYGDQWIKVPPPLMFPLQQIRANGRPLAIVFLILLVFLALQTQSNWRQRIFPKAIDYLMVVQFAIFAKTLLYGSQEFALISGLTFGGIIFMLKMGLGRWMSDDENFHLAVKSIAVAGLIFIVINGVQFLVNRQPITFVQGRFLGTTGNPQHAGVLLAATIPCLMFLIQSSPGWNFAKFLWSGVLLVTMYFLLLTGSRTGLIMGAISILLFYRNNGGAWFRVIFFLAILAALVMPFLHPDSLSSSSTGIDGSVSDRFTSTNNTREGAWNGMWSGFMNNIVFGSPLEGDRMGFGENSWLAAGDQLGLVGFIPMMMMGWESVKLIWKLNQLSNRDSYYFFQSSAIIAGLGSMLIGSFFESFLLGNLTFAMLAFLIYLLMGGYLLEVDRVRTHYARAEAEAEFADRSGVYQ